jgi:hypothetical protein
MNLHPVDWYNFYGKFADIFAGCKTAHLITDTEAAWLTGDAPNRPTFKYNGNKVEVLLDNDLGFTKGGQISLFQLLTAVKFKHDQQAAISHIMFDLMELDIPYIRVGTDYYKVIHKQDRYGGKQTHLKPWGKDEIKQDHSKTFLQSIPKFDDFIIVPNNKEYSPIVNNCYNLYSEFAHKPIDSEVIDSDIPVSLMFMKHIFGDQIETGFKYMKIIYENPKQTLPILTLVSKERETGKTTFINWFEMIFGSNSILIAPEDILKHFNSNYATKNIVLIDETFVEKQSGVEKLKSLSTAKSINVSQKFVSEYSIPLYMKIILCTNKVKDFMRIDSDEIRFWIRPIPIIKGKKNVNIEEDLFNEIPKFLKYLNQLPAINFDTGSRMVLTESEIRNSALLEVKEESRSWLHKELEIHIEDYFNAVGDNSFMATPTEIKAKWYSHNNQVSIPYIKKVLMEEMGLKPKEKMRYYPFEEKDYFKTKVSKPFEFKNQNKDFIDFPNPDKITIHTTENPPF